MWGLGSKFDDERPVVQEGLSKLTMRPHRLSVHAPIFELWPESQPAWRVPFVLFDMESESDQASVAALSRVCLDGREIPLDAVSLEEGAVDCLNAHPAHYWLDEVGISALACPSELGFPSHPWAEAGLPGPGRAPAVPPPSSCRRWYERSLLVETSLRNKLCSTATPRSGVSQEKSPATAPYNALILNLGLPPGPPGSVHRLEFAFSADPRGLRGQANENINSSCAHIAWIVSYSFPKWRGWFPGDMHLHSNYSDGMHAIEKVTEWLKKRGYMFAYFTDHVDLLDDRWEAYVEDSKNASDRRMLVLPGCEVTTAGTDGLPPQTVPYGDLLAYGIKGLGGLQNAMYSPQQAIDNILASQPPSSSCVIAHPFGVVPWVDWGVSGCDGIEIMSGWIQTRFGRRARPVAKWAELLAVEREAATVPSPRAGSDYHFGIYPGYVTYVNLPAYWPWLGYSSRKRLLDLALRRGKTVASKRGSIATFSMNGHAPGSKLSAADLNCPCQVAVSLETVVGGRAILALIREPGSQPVFITRTEVEPRKKVAFQRQIDLGSERRGSYWLYVHVASRGLDDIVYTSPVSVR